MCPDHDDDGRDDDPGIQPVKLGHRRLRTVWSSRPGAAGLRGGGLGVGEGGEGGHRGGDQLAGGSSERRWRVPAGRPGRRRPATRCGLPSAGRTARANVCAVPAWLTNVPSFSKFVVPGRTYFAASASRSGRSPGRSAQLGQISRAWIAAAGDRGSGSRRRRPSPQPTAELVERDDFALDLLEHRLDADAVRALFGADRELRRLDRRCPSRPSGTCHPRRRPAPGRARAARPCQAPSRSCAQRNASSTVRNGDSTRRRPGVGLRRGGQVGLHLREQFGVGRGEELVRWFTPAAG